MTNEDYDWYILEVNPEPWAVGPIAYARRAGKMTAYMGQNAQLAAYKEAVQEALLEQNPEQINGEVSLRFYFWRTQADYETLQGRRARKHEADVTNLQKATEDALQGILFKNDKDVVDVRSVRVEQSPTAPGRVVVGVAPARDIKFTEYPFDKIQKARAPVKPHKELNGQLEIEELF